MADKLTKDELEKKVVGLTMKEAVELLKANNKKHFIKSMDGTLFKEDNAPAHRLRIYVEKGIVVMANGWTHEARK